MNDGYGLVVGVSGRKVRMATSLFEVVVELESVEV